MSWKFKGIKYLFQFKVYFHVAFFHIVKGVDLTIVSYHHPDEKLYIKIYTNLGAFKLGSEAYFKPCKWSNMEHLVKIVNGF